MFRFRRKKKSTDPSVIVQRFIDAANRHDAVGIAECLHPDFDSMQPIYPSRNFRGSDQVRRNWQAIFQSEPGFRLTLLRSAVADGTVWVELHGAGKEVEVAGVFIMGVENNLVRWARVYSAVVDQEFRGPVETGDGPAEVVLDDDGVHDARVAAELREMIDAGRQTAAVREAAAPAPELAQVRDEDTLLWGRPTPQEEAVPDDLSTGEVPQVVVDEWAAQDERLDAGAPFDEAEVEEEPVALEAVVEPAAEADVGPVAPDVEFEPAGSEVEPLAVDEEPAMVDDGLEVEPLVAVDAEPADPEVPPEPVATADEVPAEPQPVAAAEPEPVAGDEVPAEPEPVAAAEPEPVAAAEVPPEPEPVATAEPEPVATAEERAPGDRRPADLPEPAPPAPSREPLIELVRPPADVPDERPPPPPPPPAPATDGSEGEPEGAVLELKPERRFRRIPRPSGRRS